MEGRGDSLGSHGGIDKHIHSAFFPPGINLLRRAQKLCIYHADVDELEQAPSGDRRRTKSHALKSAGELAESGHGAMRPVPIDAFLEDPTKRRPHGRGWGKRAGTFGRAQGSLELSEGIASEISAVDNGGQVRRGKLAELARGPDEHLAQIRGGGNTGTRLPRAFRNLRQRCIWGGLYLHKAATAADRVDGCCGIAIQQADIDKTQGRTADANAPWGAREIGAEIEPGDWNSRGFVDQCSRVEVVVAGADEDFVERGAVDLKSVSIRPYLAHAVRQVADAYVYWGAVQGSGPSIGKKLAHLCARWEGIGGVFPAAGAPRVEAILRGGDDGAVDVEAPLRRLLRAIDRPRTGGVRVKDGDIEWNAGALDELFYGP